MADQTNWRQKHRTKQMAATDEAKAVFLASVEENGRLYDAAEKAGASYMSFLRARDKDEEFAQAWDEALGLYKDRVKARHQHLVFNDEVTEQLDAKGNVKSVNKRAYEKSVHKELEATNPADYRPGQTIDLQANTTGVLVVGQKPTLEEFARQEFDANEKAQPPHDPLVDQLLKEEGE